MRRGSGTQGQYIEPVPSLPWGTNGQTLDSLGVLAFCCQQIVTSAHEQSYQGEVFSSAILTSCKPGLEQDELQSCRQSKSRKVPKSEELVQKLELRCQAQKLMTEECQVELCPPCFRARKSQDKVPSQGCQGTNRPYGRFPRVEKSAQGASGSTYLESSPGVCVLTRTAQARGRRARFELIHFSCLVLGGGGQLFGAWSIEVDGTGEPWGNVGNR